MDDVPEQDCLLRRRDLLAFAAASAAGGTLNGGSARAVDSDRALINRTVSRPLAASSPGAAARLASTQVHEDGELTWLPAWRIKRLIETREVSPVEVTDHVLGRIEDLDGRLHAFRMVDYAGAREQARRAETVVRSGERLGRLQGVPIGLKEHIPAKGLTWYNLSTGQKSVATRDSIEAARLREAGAIIVGSLVAQGGTPSEKDDARNPWDLGRVPGGSSPGSAVATAGGLLPVTIAADGRGSTRLPAAFCGNVGMRATRGRVPSIHQGVVNPRLMTESGPMARDVRDAATVLEVLAGADGRDIACLQDTPPDYLAGLDRGIADMRLAWTDDFGYAAKYAGPDTPEIIRRVRSAAFGIWKANVRIETTAEVWEDPDFASRVVLASDPVLNSVIRARMQQNISPEDVVRAQDSRQRIWQKCRDVLQNVDFIISPTIHFLAPTMSDWIAEANDPAFSASYTAYTSAANLLGWPAITLPVGRMKGLPIGLHILGLPNSEPRMLQLANTYLGLQS